jgi:hypothetical protein
MGSREMAIDTLRRGGVVAFRLPLVDLKPYSVAAPASRSNRGMNCDRPSPTCTCSKERPTERWCWLKIRRYRRRADHASAGIVLMILQLAFGFGSRASLGRHLPRPFGPRYRYRLNTMTMFRLVAQRYAVGRVPPILSVGATYAHFHQSGSPLERSAPCLIVPFGIVGMKVRKVLAPAPVASAA